MLDLHCHTTHSDGTLSPTAVVQAAIAAGVKALAITDHDTISAWDEAIAAAGTDLDIVPGLELSTLCQQRSMHILGFYPDPDRIRAPLQVCLEGRWQRAQQMVERLADLGCAIALPPLAGNQVPGRPHIAIALVQAGYVRSYQDAFAQWIGDGKPAYVPYQSLSGVEGVKLLRRCGAVPVWAHPYLFHRGEVEQILPELVEAGLMGLEVYHPTHTPSQRHRLQALCQQYGLLMTGGSDYHGPHDRDDHPTQLNQMQLPYALLEPLRQAARLSGGVSL